MEFHDFQIRAWTVDLKSAAVLVHSSPAGAMQRPKIVVLIYQDIDQQIGKVEGGQVTGSSIGQIRDK